MAALLAGGLGLTAGAAPVAGSERSVAVPLAPVQQARLVAATSGEQASVGQATGSQAERINAALPFSAAPIQSARAFALSGSATDHDRALTCLTQAVYYEAATEPLAGRRAVAQVVLNRMRHPAFPKSVCGVVYQGASRPGCQFSFVCDGSLWRAPAPAAWAAAQSVAAAALAGYVEASVGQATHYHADYVAPRWAPLLAKISKIGAHIFYRWPGAWGTAAAFTGRYAGEPADPASLRPALRPGVGAGPQAPLVLAAAEAAKGPPVARAEQDVGGLLDTSKGWTLNIPLPAESGSAAARIAALQDRPAPTQTPAAAIAVASAAPLSGGGN
ncbi:cell wall hydrolase [Sphingomonas ginkgonis]|uniref:Cell wall hydrolase n=1 Tax=Sphingomonas ginkgonis TaxID=2315330 RepID=A0A3S0EPG1_9SPHN|nr:cell wall hydrolase [Sphingomonas ginkgonis]